MVKVSKRYIDPKDFSHYVNNLWSAFTLMDTKDDIRLLFKDLFTNTEYKMFAKRLEVARRLHAGQTYEQICQALKVTSRTINSISNILSSSGDGLRKADQKLKDLEKRYQRYREERKAVLERKQRPKLPGETVLPSLLKAGAFATHKAFTKSIKNKSASKHLSI